MTIESSGDEENCIAIFPSSFLQVFHNFSLDLKLLVFHFIAPARGNILVLEY